MAICTGDSIVQTIERTECIGNSLTKINSNFAALDIASCELENIITSFQTMFVGTVSYFPCNVAPTGWLNLNGQTISRSTYSNLWTFANSSGNIVTDASWTSLSAYGSFGTGDGSSTFRLPDLRGDFIRSWDNGRGVDIGRGIGTWQQDQLKAHNHNLTVRSLPGTSTSVPVEPLLTENYTPDTTTSQLQISAFGGMETRPRNVSLLACIKY